MAPRHSPKPWSHARISIYRKWPFHFYYFYHFANRMTWGLVCSVALGPSHLAFVATVPSTNTCQKNKNGLLITFGLTQSLTWKGLSRDEQAAVHVALKSSRSRMLKETEDDPGQNSFQRRDCFRRSNLSLGVTKVLWKINKRFHARSYTIEINLLQQRSH